jgi:hypothetical protein
MERIENKNLIFIEKIIKNDYFLFFDIYYHSFSQMISITGFYIVFNSIEHNFVFITYDNYVKIIYNKKIVNINLENLIKIKQLFQIYFLSFISSNYNYNDNIKRIMIRKYNFNHNSFDNNYSFNEIKKNYMRSNEPKRESSMRKQKKLLKMIYYDLNGFEPNRINLFY